MFISYEASWVLSIFGGVIVQGFQVVLDERRAWESLRVGSVEGGSLDKHTRPGRKEPRSTLGFRASRNRETEKQRNSVTMDG